VWDEAVGECEREELMKPLMDLFEYLGGVQLFEQGKRWRVESGSESKSDMELDMGGWRMLLELPYFKNESVRLEDGTPKHTKELVRLFLVFSSFSESAADSRSCRTGRHVEQDGFPKSCSILRFCRFDFPSFVHRSNERCSHALTT